ncbi:MAG: hypothetical protein ABR579_02215 [Actinomycetota bacterium]
MRRTLGLLAALFLVSGLAAPARADIDHTVCPRMGTAPGGTSFDIGGSGAQAIVGGWRVQGESADLCFRGPAGIYGPTSVTAQWTSAWHPVTKGGFSGDFQLTTADPSDDVTYTVAFRARFSNRGWGPWLSDTFKVSPPASLAGGADDGVTFVVSAGKRPRHLPKVRWQWKIIATTATPTALDASVNLMTH